MDPVKDRILRNVTWVVTAIGAGIVVTSDFGPQPHAFSSIVSGIKAWFWQPSKEELTELQRRRAVAIKQRGDSSE